MMMGITAWEDGKASMVGRRTGEECTPTERVRFRWSGLLKAKSSARYRRRSML